MNLCTMTLHESNMIAFVSLNFLDYCSSCNQFEIVQSILGVRIPKNAGIIQDLSTFDVLLKLHRMLGKALNSQVSLLLGCIQSDFCCLLLESSCRLVLLCGFLKY